LRKEGPEGGVIFWWCPRGDTVIFVEACVKLKELHGNLMQGHGDYLDQACLERCRAMRGSFIGIDKLDNPMLAKKYFGR
jgi:hypothetical protein